LLFKDTYGPDDLPTGGAAELVYPLFADTDVQQFDTIVLKGQTIPTLHRRHPSSVHPRALAP
jgi:hypothetical protein